MRKLFAFLFAFLLTVPAADAYETNNFQAGNTANGAANFAGGVLMSDPSDPAKTTALGMGTYNTIGNSVLPLSGAASALYQISGGLIIDPRFYGAACNAQYFGANSSLTLSITSGSNVVTIGGGYIVSAVDVGKKFAINAQYGTAGIPTATVTGFNATSNTLTINQTPTVTTSSAGGVLANDDTPAFRNSMIYTAIYHASTVLVPDNCAVAALAAQSGVTMTGVQASNSYGYSNDVHPILYHLSTEYSEDTGRLIGVDITNTGDFAMKGFMMKGSVFPYLNYAGISGVCVGTTTGNQGVNTGLKLEDMSFGFRPNAVGYPLTMVATTASSSGSLLTVTAASSNAIHAGDPVMGMADGTVIVSQASGTTGGVGTYNISLPQTVASGSFNILSDAPAGAYIFGEARDVEFASNGIGMYGQFSDWTNDNAVFSSNFYMGEYMGGGTAAPGSGGVSRFIGGRFEETHVGFYCKNCYLVNFDGTQFQFDQGYHILLGPGWQEISLTGGIMQGGGGGEPSGYQAMIGFAGASGTSGHFHASNVSFDKSDYSSPNVSTAYLVAGLTAGSYNPDVAIEGGETSNGYATGKSVWASGEPTLFKVDSIDDPKAVSKTAAYTLQSDDDAHNFNNTGATAAEALTLPTTPRDNYTACFVVKTAYSIAITAPSGVTIGSGTSATTSGGNIGLPATVGSNVCVKAISSTQWNVTSSTGTLSYN